MQRESKATRPGAVSIIIPSYNAARFLKDTLESVFAQTYSTMEIIVIDDGSTDGTTELIRNYGHRVQAEFGPNRGASAARNRGTALAHGEFIQYLDADDLLMPDAIEHRVAALQESSADVAYSDWERLVEIEPGVFRKKEIIVRRIEDVHAIPHVALLTMFWAPPAAFTYRSSIVDKIGGWKEWLPVIQDARFLQDAALVGGKFVYVPGIGAKYREHLGSRLSRNSDAAFVSDVFHNACDLHQVLKRRGGPTKEECRALAQIYEYVGRSVFSRDKVVFRECTNRLYEVEPGFRPSWPKTARLASDLLGFEAAGVLLGALKRMRSVPRLFRKQPHA